MPDAPSGGAATPPRRLRDRDLDDYTPMAMAMPPTIICLLAEVLLRRTGRIGAIAFWLSILLLDPLLWAGFVAASRWLLHRGSRAMVSMLTASASLAPEYQYSAEDALVARGDMTGAVTSYRALLDARPEDIEARLRLANLFESLNEADRAETCYLAARSRQPSAAQEARIGNGLIDLYQRTGDRDKLKSELSRFARRFEHTAAGKHAREHLRMLAREDGAPGD